MSETLTRLTLACLCLTGFLLGCGESEEAYRKRNAESIRQSIKDQEDLYAQREEQKELRGHVKVRVQDSLVTTIGNDHRRAAGVVTILATAASQRDKGQHTSAHDHAPIASQFHPPATGAPYTRRDRPARDC